MTHSQISDKPIAANYQQLRLVLAADIIQLADVCLPHLMHFTSCNTISLDDCALGSLG